MPAGSQIGKVSVISVFAEPPCSDAISAVHSSAVADTAAAGNRTGFFRYPPVGLGSGLDPSRRGAVAAGVPQHADLLLRARRRGSDNLCRRQRLDRKSTGLNSSHLGI